MIIIFYQEPAGEHFAYLEGAPIAIPRGEGATKLEAFQKLYANWRAYITDLENKGNAVFRHAIEEINREIEQA